MALFFLDPPSGFFRGRKGSAVEVVICCQSFHLLFRTSYCAIYIQNGDPIRFKWRPNEEEKEVGHTVRKESVQNARSALPMKWLQSNVDFDGMSKIQESTRRQESASQSALQVQSNFSKLAVTIIVDNSHRTHGRLEKHEILYLDQLGTLRDANCQDPDLSNNWAGSFKYSHNTDLIYYLTRLK